MFGHMLDMLDHQFNGCVSISTTVRTEKAGSKIHADNASSFTDRIQLLVAEISRMRTTVVLAQAAASVSLTGKDWGQLGAVRSAWINEM
jgi:hypothetical protein